MKCQTTELEIETIVSRIKNGDMDLQPDFQRGEIWSVPKKKKLIDSILRGWRIPPIHVVLSNLAIDEVLDGQQRLAAIRDFYDNMISVDGNIEPFDENIKALDGLYYQDLPREWQRRFRQYSINVVRLTEYNPEEPAELFYRLNQPNPLTSAEQRNAYSGVTRDQVKRLSKMFIELGGSRELLGFSNSRLAYDEIISKFCYSVELGTLKKKITSTDISEQYRYGKPFSDNCINAVEETIRKFLGSICQINDFKFSFNKATLFSWFVYTRQHLDMGNDQYSDIIVSFEFCRSFVKGKFMNSGGAYVNLYNIMNRKLPFFELMLNTFNQRSSMASTDALSIIYRDVIISIFSDALLDNTSNLLNSALLAFSNYRNMNSVLDEIVSTYSWGEYF